MGSAYEVIARKYRPQHFDDLVGQEAIARVLRGAIEQERVGHAFLFCGPRGVGKTSAARILARALNCERGPTPRPCGECPRCHDITHGRDPDVVEIDGASHRKIDDVRAIREQVGYAPMRGHTKLYIIDEVHQLTSEAFNALLKTLEEPPSHVKFVFATTEPEKVPETIRSRCQVHEFRPIGVADIAGRLRTICEAEERAVSDDVLHAIARGARGGMRDAQTMLDQLLSLGTGEPTLEDLEGITGRAGTGRALGWLSAAREGDVAQVLTGLDALLLRGFREEDLLEDAIDVLREVLYLAACGAETDLVRLGEDARGQAVALVDAVRGAGSDPLDWVDAVLTILLRARADLKRAGTHSRLVLELSWARIARLSDSIDLEAALANLDRAGVAPGAARAGGAGAAPPRPARPTGTRPAPERVASPVPPARERPGPARSATPAAPRGTPATRPADAEDVFERWLRALRARDKGLAELFEEKGEVQSWSGSRFALRLRAPDFTDLAVVGDRQARGKLQASLTEVLGEEAVLEVDTREEPSPVHPATAGGSPRPVTPKEPAAETPDADDEGAPRPAPRRAPRAAHPLVDELRDLFQGEEVDDEPRA